MNWSDRALVLGTRLHGEASVILELMTRDHGRHLGLVHGGRSARLRPVLQPGNTVEVTWRARLDEHLGTFAVEGEVLRAARVIASPLAVHAVALLASHLRLLPERDPHAGLFERAEAMADRLHEPGTAPALVARFELALLAELGFGLDLASCAATGETADLAYVSPRSGRAVGRRAGEPYQDRLLRLPGFLQNPDAAGAPEAGEVAAAFRLTGFFMDRHVYGPRGLAPDERARFIRLAEKIRPEAASGRLEEGMAGPTDSASDGTA